MAGERFFLIDGHSQIFRAYWAPMTDLTAPNGEPCKATYVFCTMLLGLLQRERPDFLAVALDGPEGPTRRLKLQPSYKETRDRLPEDLVPQIERIQGILRKAGIPLLLCEGEEADDVIATVVETLRCEDLEILIVSRDKDLYQVLTDKVKLFDPLKGEIIDPETLNRTKGYLPHQAVDVQTLAGDPVDNIPGVPLVGEKKAASLVRKYGSAEGVLAHAEQLTPKLKENILRFAQQLARTRQLVTLRRDCPLRFDLEDARCERFNLKSLLEEFQALGFRRLTHVVEELSGLRAEKAREVAVAVGPGSADLTVESITDPSQLPQLAERLRSCSPFAVDTEATSLRPRQASLIGLSFAWKEGAGVYVPVRSQRGPTVPIEAVRSVLGPVLQDPRIEKIGQNLKYDLQILRGAGIELRGISFDTMVASYLLNSERRSHSLDSLAKEYLSYEPIPITALIGRGAKQIPLQHVDPAQLARYAAEDAEVAWRLWAVMKEKLSEAGLTELFLELEMPLVSVLADMEWHGVCVDRDLLAAMRKECEKHLCDLQDRIWKAAGRPFNLSSPRQLAEVLFDDLGLPVVKRTKTSRSTDAEVLRFLAQTSGSELPSLVLSYRELAKLVSTYVDVLPRLVCPATGRVHPSYHQTVAATGRLSSSEPNIQNIPIRTPEGRRIRQAFVAQGPDKVLLSADYSQVELRLLAHFSGDKALAEAFAAGEDIHRWVASRIWRMRPEEVPRTLREQAKAVNFGIIYGQTPFGLARTLGIPRSEAARFIETYKKKFQGIARFEERVLQEARKQGAVRTCLGRRRPLPDLNSRNAARRRQAERLAVNTVIQGSAADLIKCAMVKLHRRLAPDSETARMIIQVHDELVFEVARTRVEEVAQWVTEEMTGALPLSVPLKLDVAWGRSWLEGKA